MKRLALAILVMTMVAATAHAAAKKKPFVPPNYPVKTAPVNWPGNPGTRLDMRDIPKKYPLKDIVVKVNVSGWTEAMWEAGDMGTYKVGDRAHFRVVIGDKNSRYFGSVKDGRDGGQFRCTVYWMDEAGKKVLKEDKTSVRFACATCGGFYSMYFGMPSFAKTGRHRLHISYKNTRTRPAIDVSKDLYFNVVNDGSWEDTTVLETATKKYPSVVVLQPGRPCPALGIESYAGVSDTYIHATHRVPDRNTDHCNYGTLAVIRIGSYGQEQRTLMRFELRKVPTDCEVAAAWLQLYLADWPGPEARKNRCSSAFTAYDVLKDWTAGRGNGSRWRKDPVIKGEASWLCHAYPSKWAKPGCGEPGVDRSAEPVGQTAKQRKRKCWVTIPLDAAMVSRWVAEPKTNRGVMLAGSGNAGQFHSSEYEDPSMRPRLILAFKKKLPEACAIGGACERPEGK